MIHIQFTVALLLGCLTASHSCSAADSPIDLSHWMLTLPTDTRKPGYADEIEPPALATFQRPPFFVRDTETTSIRFRAPCGGVTTRTSQYPRCELREWNPDTADRAAWSTTEGTHTLELQAHFTALPLRKRHVVCAQIHDADDDILMLRLETTKLFVERNETERVMLTRKYQLGDQIDVRIEASAGRIRLWYAEKPVMDWSKQATGCYFKAGCYTQSNPTKGDAPDDYAEVVIDALTVSHQSK